MKKLFVYFVLISSLFYGVSCASSKGNVSFTKEELQELAATDPYITISNMFKEGFQNNDYREKERIIATSRVILQLYPNRPDLQTKAIDAFGQCMRTQIVNGQRKYTDRDANILVNFSKKKLGLN